MNWIEFRLKINWHNFKNLWRRWRRGAGCCDIFSLDYYLARKIIKPLKAFRNSNLGSHPSELKSVEEWEKILDEMIWAFEYILKDESGVYEDGKYNHEKTMELYEREQKGFELFGKYFRNLWI